MKSTLLFLARRRLRDLSHMRLPCWLATIGALLLPGCGCDEKSDSGANSQRPIGTAYFDPDTANLTVLPNHDWRLESEARFVDAKGKRWTAPAGTLTDGASIPRVFLTLFGGPFFHGHFRAALVHDAYCDSRNAGEASYHQDTWQAVHRMFYEACLAEGTGKPKALAMFAAVRLMGPRWLTTDSANTASSTSPDLEARASRARLKSIADHQRYILAFNNAPPEFDLERVGLIAARYDRQMLPIGGFQNEAVQEFARCAAWINANDPSIDELEEWMIRLEAARTAP